MTVTGHALDERMRIGGRDVHVTVSGTPDPTAPPLLLLMGLGGNTGMWQPLRGMLDATRTTVAFDVPGTGRSPVPRLPMPLPLVGRLALRVLDRLGIDRADVAGVSWGGMLAQQVAVTAPRRIRRVVLSNTHFGLGSVPATPGALRALMSTGRYHDADALVHAARMFGGRAAQMGPAMREHAAARLAHPPSTRGYWYQMLALTGWSSLPFLPLLRQRTLVLGGGDDPAVPAVNAKIMKALLPHAELVVVPEGGHLMLFDQAADLLPMITRFLDAP